MKRPLEKSPLSFDVHVGRLPKKGMPVTIDATQAQRDALAAEHGLLAVERLHAEVTVAEWKRNGVRVVGQVEAQIVQACVVSLEPVSAVVREEVSAVFVPEDSKLGREGFGQAGEIVLDPDGPDSPEVFAGDSIDVGAVVEEFFALGIDPYPRKPGAVAPPAGVSLADAGETSSGETRLGDLLRRR